MREVWQKTAQLQNKKKAKGVLEAMLWEKEERLIRDWEDDDEVLWGQLHTPREQEEKHDANHHKGAGHWDDVYDPSREGHSDTRANQNSLPVQKPE